MTFGPIMHLKIGELAIELAPLTRESMGEFVRAGGMQTHTVSRYLGSRTAPTLEDEHAWYDKVCADEHSFIWGIWAVDGNDRTVIGTSGLHDQQDWAMSIWTSGSMIFRPEYWSRGIGSRCHMARTWYAFRQLRANVIYSCALLDNTRSLNALLKCGYAQVATRRNARFVDGRYLHEAHLECVSPDPIAWREWWHGDRVPRAFREARTRTLAALAWADEHVQLL